MDHKTKSFLLVLLLLGIMVTIGFFANFNEGITGTMVADTIACYGGSDCDDGIEKTEDICRNPGTEYSLCVNKPVK